MATNGYGNRNNDSSIFVLYKIVNSESDSDDPFYNAFTMPRSEAGSKGPTLASVKR